MKSNVKNNDIANVLKQINIESVRQLKEKKNYRIIEQCKIKKL